MEHEEYRKRVEQAAHASESGEYLEAIEILEGLVRSSIPDLDKSVMCVNLAIVYDRMQDPEQALAWHERAIEYERNSHRFWAGEQKGVYLAKQGQYQESLRVYEQLLRRGDLSDPDRSRMEANVQSLRKLNDQPEPGAVFCPELPSGGVLRLRGSSRGVHLVARVFLGVASVQLFLPLLPFWPAQAQLLPFALSGVLVTVAVLLYLAGASLRRQSIELDASAIRYRGLFRSVEIPLNHITAVTIDSNTVVLEHAVHHQQDLVFWYGVTPALKVNSRVFEHSDLCALLSTMHRHLPAMQLDHAVRTHYGVAA